MATSNSTPIYTCLTDVTQRVTLENQIRGLAVVFGVRLPRALNPAFIQQALQASDGIPGLSAAMRGLIGARAAVLAAIVAIDADIRRMVRASDACRRLMSIPGVGPLVAVTFKSAIDNPGRIVKSKSVGALFGLVPKKYQSGERDFSGSITRTGDESVRTALYEAANVMLTRTTRFSSLKRWALEVAKRRGLKRARIALARKLGVVLHRIWVDGTTFQWTKPNPAIAG